MSEFIDYQGWRTRHYVILGSVAVIKIFLACCVSSFPYIIEELQAEFQTNRTTVSMVAGCILLGAIAGTFLGGTLSDLCGRRSVLLVAVLSGSLLVLIHLLIIELWQLVLLRVMLGVCFGAVVAVMNVYLVEFVPSNSRGWCICLAGLGWKVGSILGIGLAWALQGQWRVALSGPIVPGLFAVMVLACLAPESPRWLLIHGREDEASAVLQRLFGLDHPPKVFCVGAKTVSDSKFWSVWVRIQELFGRSIRLVTVLTLVVWMCNLGVGYAWGLWGPEIAKLLLHSDEIPYVFFIWSEAITGAAQIGYAFVLDHLGRRPVISTGLMAASLIMALLLVVPHEHLIVFVMLVLIDLPWGLAWVAKIAYTKEAFATELRGTATGFFNFWGRISGASLPILIGFLLGLSIAHAVLTMVALLLCAGMTAFLIPIETCQKPIKDVLSSDR